MLRLFNIGRLILFYGILLVAFVSLSLCRVLQGRKWGTILSPMTP